jgi:HD superfamily phosphohydrolase YqeK
MTVARARSAGLPAWAVVAPVRLAHVERVVALVDRWAEVMAVPAAERARWLRAAWLHDALRDLPEAGLRELVPDAAGPLDLLHGPAAAARAAREGERDQGVLDAVRYHSLGFAGWDMSGRVLYVADFLDPGRSFDRDARAALAERFPDDPHPVLCEVARRRMAWLVQSRWQIPEQTWRFWNSLTNGWVP